MRLEVDLALLAHGVRTVRPALRDAADGWNVIVMRAAGDALELSATGRSMSITRDITATVTEEGSVTVPARIMGDLLARGSSPLATLGSDGLNLEVGLGDLEAKLRLIDDTPPPPIRVVSAESTPASLSALEVERAGAVAVASSGDLQRPVLAGVHLGPTMAEATDTYRVARTILTTWDLDLVVPADLVRLVAAERSDVTVSFDGRVIAFRTHDASWTTPVIATAFPAIPHFAIPTNETLTCDRHGIITAVESAAVLPGALIELRSTGGDLVVSSENLEVGRIESKVPQVGATAVEALFTARYLLDALKLATTEQITFQFAERHVVIRCGSFTQLIMRRVTTQ